MKYSSSDPPVQNQESRPAKSIRKTKVDVQENHMFRRVIKTIWKITTVLVILGLSYSLWLGILYHITYYISSVGPYGESIHSQWNNIREWRDFHHLLQELNPF